MATSTTSVFASNLINIDKKTYKLEKESELRIEVIDTITIKLLSGNAEIFGSELVVDKIYKFKNRKFSIYTWYGSEVVLEGTPTVIYISTETPMMQYLNAHEFLETNRVLSSLDPTFKLCNRTMIVGGVDAGKSTLAQMLVNYAVRAQRSPIIVDLDVGQNMILPGCVSAIVVNHPSDIETGSYTATKLAHAPLCYFFGHTSPTPNEEIYKKTCESLNIAINKKLELQPEVKSSGVIINTCGWVDGLGLSILKNLISTFQVNTLIVLGHERLYNELKQDLSTSPITIIKLLKSEGVVQRDTDSRKIMRQNTIHEYFYGAHNDLAPHTRQINTADFHFMKILSSNKVPASLLPIGVKAVVEGLRAIKVGVPAPGITGAAPNVPAKNDDPLMHSIVAVLHAPPHHINNPDALIASNVAGFLNIQSYDPIKGRATVLSPCPGPFPGKVMLTGTLKWSDL